MSHVHEGSDAARTFLKDLPKELLAGASRYDTDDKLVLHVWTYDGTSYDLTAPKNVIEPIPGEDYSETVARHFGVEVATPGPAFDPPAKLTVTPSQVGGVLVLAMFSWAVVVLIALGVVIATGK